MGTVNNNFLLLGYHSVHTCKVNREEWGVVESPFEPNKEEICQMCIRYSVVVRRICKPDIGRLIRERMIGCIGLLGLSAFTADRFINQISDQFESALPVAGCLRCNNYFREIPNDRYRLSTKGMLHLLCDGVPSRT